MIRLIDIRLNAAHPELPLAEAVTYTGAPSTMLIRGVPGNCGKWCITSVYVAATFPDGSTSTRLAVQSANGVWVATLPATATSGRTASGVRIMADGEDENGEIVTGYILGVADFAVASLGVTPAPEPGATSWQMLYFDTVPGVLRKGDVAKIDGVLKIYNGTAWEAFAGDIPAPSTATPAMDGTGAAGTSAAFARGDHVHPSDTSKQDALSMQQLANIAAVPGKLDKSGGIADNLLICGTNEAIKFSDGLLYIYRKTNGTWVAQNVWDMRTSQDGTVAFLSDIYDAVQQIAPAWVSGTAYTANALVTYNGVVYQNTSGATIQSATTPDTSGSGWTAKPVSELFLPLTGGTATGVVTAKRFEVPNGAEGGLRLHYSNYNATIYYHGGVGVYIGVKQGSSGTYYISFQDNGGTLAFTAGTGHADNLAALDAQGNPINSGIPKMNVATKPANPTAGNLVKTTATGELQDAGYHFEVRNGIPCIVQYT